MVKFQFLAQFPVDYLPHLVVSSLMLFLCEFTAFAYYVIDRFVSISTLSTSDILLHLVYFYFDIFSLYGVVLFCYYK